MTLNPMVSPIARIPTEYRRFITPSTYSCRLQYRSRAAVLVLSISFQFHDAYAIMVDSKDGQDSGKVDAVFGDTIVIMSEGDRAGYKLPKSQV